MYLNLLCCFLYLRLHSNENLFGLHSDFRILYGDSAPFFALVGVSLASGTGIITKEEELEGVCWEIRVIHMNYLSLKYLLKTNISGGHFQNEMVLS